jgi:hypothetical protein
MKKYGRHYLVLTVNLLRIKGWIQRIIENITLSWLCVSIGNRTSLYSIWHCCMSKLETGGIGKKKPRSNEGRDTEEAIDVHGGVSTRRMEW